MMAYRSAIHETTGYTPVNLMFGREIHLPIDIMLGTPEDHMEEDQTNQTYTNYVSKSACPVPTNLLEKT